MYFSWTRSHLLCSRSPYSRLSLCSFLLAGYCLAAAGRGNRMGALTPGHTDPKFTSISTKGPLNGGAGVPERERSGHTAAGVRPPCRRSPSSSRGVHGRAHPSSGAARPYLLPGPHPYSVGGWAETLSWWRTRSPYGESGGQPFTAFLPGAPSLSAFCGRSFVPSPGASP